MICPATRKTLPPSTIRITKGETVYLLCPWCDTGDGQMQPHPLEGCRMDELGNEGGIVYTQVGQDVHRSLNGCQPHYYCRLSAWPSTSAAKRIAEQKQTYTAAELQAMAKGEHKRGRRKARGQ